MKDMIPESTVERTDSYIESLRNQWESIRVYENKVMAYFISISLLPDKQRTITTENKEDMYHLIADSIGLWKELLPKMKGKSLYDDFMKFEKSNMDPSLYIDDAQRLLDLTEALREALDLLEVTKIAKELR